MARSSGGDEIRVRVLICGRVQGVFFRARASEQAHALDVAGWIRNLADGRVEAVFEGTRDTIDRLVEWCRQCPPPADVSGVDLEYEEPEGLRTFEIR